MNYKEYKDIKQNEFSELPIFWAFSMEQFSKAMEERGLTKDDTDKIYALGSGGYYLRSDADKIRAFFSKEDELPKLMQDYDFAKDAIKSEMADHEYFINWQADYDVCSCFGNVEYTESDTELNDYFTQLNWSKETQRAYFDAKRELYKEWEENDLF